MTHRAARRFGTRDALIAGEHRTTFRTLDESANRMAHALAASGLMASASQASRAPSHTDIDGDALVQIVYTSGTTGRQKAVMHSYVSIHSVLMFNLVEWHMAWRGEMFSFFHGGRCCRRCCRPSRGTDHPAGRPT